MVRNDRKLTGATQNGSARFGPQKTPRPNEVRGVLDVSRHHTSGGRGIRTHGVGLPTQLFSRQPPSATRRALLRGTTLRERGASRDVRPGSARVREAVGDAGDRAAAGGEVLFETVEVDG